MSTQQTACLHLQLAEAGKSCSLKGDHHAALERYRHALRLALAQKASPVFLQHYTECILDALEEAGHFTQALEMTEHALAEQASEPGKFARAVHATLAERRVLLLFSLGKVDRADKALSEALEYGGPVLKELARARKKRLSLSRDWLAGIKRRHGRGSAREQVLRRDYADAGEHYFLKEIAHG